MKYSAYLLIRNDKIKYMLLNWNKEQFTIQNKLQVLKELLDVSADYIYQKNGKNYSSEEKKYSLFATTEEFYEVDKKHLGGKTVVVFQEDLKEEKDKYQILNEFVLKMYKAVSDDIYLNSDKPYVLRDMKLDEFTKLQLDVLKDKMSKKR